MLRSIFFILSCSVFFSHASAQTQVHPVKVVASFSVLADWVRQIGGDNVEVFSLVDLDEDVHVFQASPADLRRVADADVMFINGLDLEGWLGRLISTSGFTGELVVLSSGIEVIDTAAGPAHDGHELHAAPALSTYAEDHEDHEDHDHHGTVDPHAWLSPKMAKIYVSNIATALTALNQQLNQALNAESRESVRQGIASNLQAYLIQLDELDQSIRTDVSALPKARRQVVVPHSAFAYFERDYGVHFHSLQGMTSESESSAAAFANIVRTIRRENINSIFGENTGNTRLINRVAEEAGLTLGGLLISGALSRQLAPTYLDMMRYNSSMLMGSLQPAN